MRDTQLQLTALPEPEPEGVSHGSDEALAALAGHGDVESFVALYRRHLGPVYSYLYARTGNRQDAEDVTTLAFERAWQALPGYRPTGSFKGWLFTVAYRAYADYRRKHAPAPSTVGIEDGYSVADPTQGPEELALVSEQLQRVLQIIKELNQEQQEAICLRFLAELRYSEIAQVMGKSEAAVKMTAYRALEEIRRRYGDVQE